EPDPLPPRHRFPELEGAVGPARGQHPPVRGKGDDVDLVLPVEGGPQFPGSDLPQLDAAVVHVGEAGRELAAVRGEGEGTGRIVLTEAEDGPQLPRRGRPLGPHAAPDKQGDQTASRDEAAHRSPPRCGITARVAMNFASGWGRGPQLWPKWSAHESIPATAGPAAAS